MQKKNFLYIGIAIAVVAIIVSISFGISTDVSPIQESFPELDFTYTDANLKLKERLFSHGVSMSSPVKLEKTEDIAEFCTFFEDENKQSQVDYCTSTELRNSDGEFLGNIHMVGSQQMPKMVLALVQTNPFMKDIDDIKSVFGVVIEDLICNCWEEIKPGQIETIGSWIDKQREFHTSDTKPTSKSNLNLEGYNLQMELTTNQEGYLWKLILSK
ncbi:MAG TPA: hypothetical protein VH562_04155 [Nitrosopumilaceae archaeon]